MNTEKIAVHDIPLEIPPESPVVVENGPTAPDRLDAFPALAKEVRNLLFRAEGILAGCQFGTQRLTTMNAHCLESLRLNLKRIEDLIEGVLGASPCEGVSFASPSDTPAKRVPKKCAFTGLIGNSPPLRRVHEMIEKIADTDTTILISGESGTGKELIARIIHLNSRRSQGAFVPLNCAAIPKDLLESELFGRRGLLPARSPRESVASNSPMAAPCSSTRSESSIPRCR